MKKAIIILSAWLFVAFCFVTPHASAAEKCLYDFEQDTQGWEVPEWALEKDDHVAQSIEESKDFAKKGKGSLKVNSSFSGKAWTASMVEIAEYFDWSGALSVSCDIYLPKEAPEGLKAKMILTVGDEWVFTEMSRSVALVPGQWTTVTASLADGSTDFRKTVVDKAFRSDVRKVGIRVESNKKPEYKGPFYIDNVRIAE